MRWPVIVFGISILDIGQTLCAAGRFLPTSGVVLPWRSVLLTDAVHPVMVLYELGYTFAFEPTDHKVRTSSLTGTILFVCLFFFAANLSGSVNKQEVDSEGGADAAAVLSLKYKCT